jgi:putative hydrolase of HD superfamily
MEQANELAKLVSEVLVLRYTNRAGWARANVPVALMQSVADHCYGSTIIAMAIALLGNIEPSRSMVLAAVHDLGETRTGDIALPMRRLLENVKVDKEVVDQLAEQAQRRELFPNAQEFLETALEEFRAKKTLSAQIAYDANVIEMGVQALQYQRQGFSTQEWLNDVEKPGGLLTPFGRELWYAIRREPDFFAPRLR